MGYPEARTPVLDSLAAAGVQFRAADTPVPVTLPAVTSLLTGRHPFHHRVRDNEGFVLGPGEETLAQRFRKAGYRTAAVVASSVLAADRGLDRGFETYEDAFGGPYPVYTPSQKLLAEEFARTRRRADVVTTLARERLDAVGGDPFFLFVHYFDVHMHYDPPPPYAALHPGRPYDGEVSFVDHEIGRLLDGIRGRKDVLVVVVADHGESQGEHGEPQHGFLLYQATLHVPFLAAGPGIPAGTVRRDGVSLIDVEPTLAAVFDLPEAALRRDGRALQWTAEAPGPVPLYAETFHSLLARGWSHLRAVRRGDWKLIRGPYTEVYDLAADPRELHPVEDPARRQELDAVLDALIEGDDAEAVYREAVAGGDPERRDLLQSLGYAGGASDAPEGMGERPHPKDALPAWNDVQWAKKLTRTALTLIEAGHPDEGLALIDSALALDPRGAEPYALRAHLRMQQGDRGRAASDARSALERNSRHTPSRALLAAIAEVEGRPGEAHAGWLKVIESDEGNVAALTFLASWHLDRNEPALALPYLRGLVSAEPENAAAHFNLAEAARAEGRAGEAREHFEAFLRLVPGDTAETRRVRAVLEELGGAPGSREPGDPGRN